MNPGVTWFLGAVGATLLLTVVFLRVVMRRRAGKAAAPAETAELSDAERLRLDRIRRQAVRAEAVDETAADQPAAATAPPPPPSDWPVAETVSVVLRRQVPVRFDKPARSWLGGLPMLPDGIEWPRGVNPETPEEGERPLHFVAQVACADLPADLWGGFGPREGWLLFFVNANSADCADPALSRVIHTLEPGQERLPPADIGPVDDGRYAGSAFEVWLGQADVPALWRRWPVDLVAVPNEAAADLARELHAGDPVAADGAPPPRVPPFSWRSIGHGWAALVRAVHAPPVDGKGTVAPLQPDLEEQGGPAGLLAELDAQERLFDEGPPGELLARAEDADLSADEQAAIADLAGQKLKRLKQRGRVAQLVERYPATDDLLAFLAAEQDRLDLWRTSALSRLEALDGHIRATDPDSLLDAEHWQDIDDFLHADRCTVWQLVAGAGRSVRLARRTTRLSGYFRPAAEAGVAAVAADYYLDPQRRSLLPPAVATAFEPWWRSLADNRPHRIGGRHDGVQSVALAGPTPHPLLLQLASDAPMQWRWGDAGALYWFIGTGALASGAVGSAACHLESH